MTDLLTGNDRYLGFSLGEEEYGIPLLKVREVIGMPEITPVPQSPKHFIGIMNLRGQVISIIDLRTKLAIPPKKGGETAVVICDIGGSYLGIVVDSVNQVYSPKSEEIADRPEIQNSKANQFITGVYRHNKSLVLLLDIARTLDMEDHAAMARGTPPLAKAA
ncbi:MAG: purine-binding chemotaxis protein CheW [Cryobacterium sp.]|nr:purine-binding chemotaxis protein CheW [Oligoflexia bacterium]